MTAVDTAAGPQYAVLLLCIMLLLGIPAKWVVNRFNRPISLNFINFLTAAAISAVLSKIPNTFTEEVSKAISKFLPHHIMIVFVPAFTFSKVYQMDFYIFQKCIVPALILSTLVFLIQICICGPIMFGILHSSIEGGFLLAVIAAPLHAYHITMLLKELAHYKFMGTLLEVETIFLNATVLMTYEILCGFDTKVVEAWNIPFILFRFMVPSVIYGWLMAKLIMVLLRYMYTQSTGALCVIVGYIYLAYMVAEYVLATSGVITIIIISYHVLADRHRLSEEVDHNIFQFLACLNYLIETTVFSLCTFELTRLFMESMDFTALGYGAALYFASTIARIIAYLITCALMRNVTNGIPVKCLLLLGWSGVRGDMNYVLHMCLRKEPAIQTRVDPGVMLVNVFLSLLINSSSIRLWMKILGFSDMSVARKINMNNCIKYIVEKRINIMQALKINRYLITGNWDTVREVTMIKHPYHIAWDDIENESENTAFISGAIICPYCGEEIPVLISEQHMNSLMVESQLKILKAKKVSVIKQYERGMITRSGMQVLCNILDAMIESNSKNGRIDITPFLKTNWQNKLVAILIRKLEWDKNLRPCNNVFKRFCFYLVLHKRYDLWYCVLCTIYVIGAILAIINIKSLQYVGMVLAEFIQLAFWLDLLAKLLAFSRFGCCCNSCNTYFKYWWYRFDFIILIVSSCSILSFIGRSELEPVKLIGYGFGCCRILRWFCLLQPLYARRLRKCEESLDLKVCFGYMLATSIVNACEEIIEVIDQLIEVKIIRSILVQQVIDERYKLIKIMGIIQREKPWVVITVKTKQAIQTTLVSLENSLNELKSSGFVDNVEYSAVYTEIFAKKKEFRNLEFVQASSPRMIFGSVPWMTEDTEVIEYLYNSADPTAFDTNEIICRDGSVTTGIFVIVTGLLRLKYIPKATTLNGLNNYGKLPILDYISSLKFDSKIEDIIQSGNSCGELAILTGRPYDCTIIAETPVQTYWLTPTVMKEAMKMDSNPVIGLEARMWKSILINLAVELLSEVPQYQNTSRDQIKLKLEKSFSPNLKCYKTFIITEVMEDILLMEGVCSDFASQEVFKAPKYIPRNVQRLILPRSSLLQIDDNVDVRLLIIPMVDANEITIMEAVEDMAELVSIPSSKCLLHSIEHAKLHKRRAAAATPKPPSAKLNQKVFSTASEAQIERLMSDVEKLKRMDERNLDRANK